MATFATMELKEKIEQCGPKCQLFDMPTGEKTENEMMAEVLREGI